MTLTEFLLARIAEDEDWVDTELFPYHWRMNRCRVRDECQAKRKLVALHRVSVTGQVAYGTIDGQVVEVEPESFEDIVSRRSMCAECGNVDDGPCRTLRILAEPYADHPDFRAEWKYEPSQR